jgi:hypothetical protein
VLRAQRLHRTGRRERPGRRIEDFGAVEIRPGRASLGVAARDENSTVGEQRRLVMVAIGRHGPGRLERERHRVEELGSAVIVRRRRGDTKARNVQATDEENAAVKQQRARV